VLHKVQCILVAPTIIGDSFSIREHHSFWNSNLAHLIAHVQLLNDKGCLSFSKNSPAIVAH